MEVKCNLIKLSDEHAMILECQIKSCWTRILAPRFLFIFYSKLLFIFGATIFVYFEEKYFLQYIVTGESIYSITGETTAQLFS